MKEAYYQMRGWDTATGIPTPERLNALGLAYLVNDLWGASKSG
jgi:aldehyde:ferredoxin oxidoreductase